MPVDNDKTAKINRSLENTVLINNETTKIGDGIFIGMPRKIGDYKIKGFLGKGGMGTVYEAEAENGEVVALKTLVDSDSIDSSTIERFLLEANASIKLRRHPNIITVYNTGKADNVYYIAMELIPKGKSLKQYLQENSLNFHQKLNLALQIGKALNYAHKHNILHRDIKPANILVNEFGQALLSDFGLAKMSTMAHDLTLSGVVLGTPKYMSPEQIIGKKADKQSDIYSYGVILYEMFTDKFPYEMSNDSSLPEIFNIIQTSAVIAPRKVSKEDISANLAAVIMNLLEKDPKYRYKKMSAVITDIEACISDKTVSVRVATFMDKFDRLVMRYKLISFTVIIAILGMIFVTRYYVKEIKERSSNIWFQDMQLISKDIEIKRLKENLTQGSITVSKEEDILVKALNDIVNENTENALRKFNILINFALEEDNKGLLNRVLLEKARLLMIIKKGKKAINILKELEKTCTNEGIEVDLLFLDMASCYKLNKNNLQAQKIWKELLKNKNKNLKIIAQYALKKNKTKEFINKTKNFPSSLRAISLWLALENSKITPEVRKKVKKEAKTIAKQSLPWLYYVLTKQKE